MELISKEVNYDFDEVVENFKFEADIEGFVLAFELDLQKRLKDVNPNLKKYKIFGICKPQGANMILQDDMDRGVHMPCNVVIYEMDEGVKIALQPEPASKTKAMDLVIGEIQEKFRSILENL